MYKINTLQNIPKQKDGIDCGLFMLKYVEMLTQEKKIEFTQVKEVFFKQAFYCIL